MDLSVPYSQVSDKHEAYKKACEQITPEYIAKWNIKADISYDESTPKLSAKGKGFKLDIVFADTESQIHLDLSLLLRAFKGSVLETVERKLKKHV